MSLIDLQGHFSYFCLKINVPAFPVSKESPGDLAKDDTGDEVNYNGRMTYVSNYFCCRIRSEGLLEL